MAVSTLRRIGRALDKRPSEVYRGAKNIGTAIRKVPGNIRTGAQNYKTKKVIQFNQYLLGRAERRKARAMKRMKDLRGRVKQYGSEIIKPPKPDMSTLYYSDPAKFMRELKKRAAKAAKSKSKAATTARSGTNNTSTKVAAGGGGAAVTTAAVRRDRDK